MPVDLLADLNGLKARAFTNRKAYAECPDLAQLLLRLITHVISEQQQDGWALGNKFEVLANAHMLRILTKMGVEFRDKWRFFNDETGNLVQIAGRLTKLYRAPKKSRPSLFGEDFWDDCYVMLALMSVREFMLGEQKDFLERHRKDIVDYLAAQACSNFKDVQHGKWYGPGLHAAGITFFHALVTTASWKVKEKQAEPALKALVAGIVDLLSRDGDWANFYGWHAGQVLSLYQRLRKDRKELQPLDPLIAPLKAELLARQDLNPASPTYGGWTGKSMSILPQDIIYNSTRALAALYGFDELAYQSPAAKAAHAYFHAQENGDEPMQSLKGRVNVIEVLNDLFQLRLPLRDVSLLMGITERLRRFQAAEVLLGDIGRSDMDTLRNLYRRVQEQIEDQGEPANEPMGVNGRMFQSLRDQPQLVDEFGEDGDATEKLRRFLSSPMTEVRANAARSLIHDLWTHFGYFNFLPLFERLSALEYEGKFFEQYRDHSNHQLLVFLLGAYIYFNNHTLREKLNEEILATSNSRGVAVPNVEREFLFRWKLTSTFHDVGYIFEVSPRAADPAVETARLKKESLALINGFRSDFLERFLTEHLDDTVDAKKILMSLPIKQYKMINALEDLYVLDVPQVNKDAFKNASAFFPDEWQNKELLRNYLRMCMECDTDGTALKRPAFLDHGVMSALVLLNIVDIQLHYLKQINALAGEGVLRAQPALDVIRTEDFQRYLNDAKYVRFEHAAGAIALHNIYPRLYSEKTCSDYGLANLFYPKTGTDRFAIRPAEALAYLLALTDGLQDWDRHSFRKPNFHVDRNSEPLAAPEVLIVASNSGLDVAGLTPEAQARYTRRFTEMAETLADLGQFVHVRA